MSPLSLVALLSLWTLIAIAAPFDNETWPLKNFNRYSRLERGIAWRRCGEDTSFECGRFEVPMDYYNASAGKASLAVVRLKAQKLPKLGTLFTNPGGPGLPGAELLYGFDDQRLMKAAGGRYDIVSWDPRGSWSTFPQANCFANEDEERKYLGGSPMLDGIEIRTNPPSMEDDLGHFRKQAQTVHRQLIDLGKNCTRYSPDVFQYVGTAATVRDMVRLHDYLEGPNKAINYYGFSYGTVIGMYFAQLFPRRVGRLILDGMVHPDHWANRLPHKSWKHSIMTANVSLAGFASECVKAGPKRCNFTTQGDTPEKLQERIIGLIDRAYIWKQKNPTSPLGSASLRKLLHRNMYSPHNWPNLANSLHVYDKNLSDHGIGRSNATFLSRHSIFTESNINRLKFNMAAEDDEDEEDESPVDYAQTAVTCGDAVDNPADITTKEVFEEVAKTTEANPVFGPAWSSVLYCHAWPVRAIERITGPWFIRAANEILIIGNDGDPITPFAWAKEVAESYGSVAARLVEQKGYGHLSNAMRSDCTSDIVLKYLVDNKLPNSFWTVCKTNDNLFPESPVSREPNKADGSERGQDFGGVIVLSHAFILAFVFYAALRKRRRAAKPQAGYESYPSVLLEKADKEGRAQTMPF